MSTSKLDKFDATIATKIVAIRREREVRQSCMEQIEGGGTPQLIPLKKKELMVGRAEDAGIHVQSRRASRYHALLTRQGPDYLIRDNDSHNGLFLNGVKIHSALLRDGDVIQIADCAFVFHES